MSKKTTAPNPLKTYFLHNKGRLIDKWMHYFDVYHEHFARFRNKPVTIVEFGVFHGGSLQMWKRYFGPQARIVGVDINPKSNLKEEQIEVLIGDQEDKEFLASLPEKVGPIDILIDDGGHRMSQQLVTFATLLPLIKPDGVYVVEDLHTSYWEYYGGGYGLPNTFIEFAKRLIDHLHAWHSHDPARHPVTYYTKNVRAMHVYDSIIVFDKGEVSPPTAGQTGTPSWTSATEAQQHPDLDTTGVIHAKVFTPRGGIFHESHSASAGLAMGKWRRVTIDLPWGVGDATAPIRFDPANCAALIDIAGIALRANATNEVVWRANRRTGLSDLRVAGTARRLPHNRLLRIVSYGEDPQVYLPDFGLGKLDEPLTLEAWLRIDTPHSAATAVRALDDIAAKAVDDVVGITIEPTNSARSEAAAEIAAAFRALPGIELSTGAQDENGGPSALSLDGPATPVLSVYVADESGFAEERAVQLSYEQGRWVHIAVTLEYGLGCDCLRLDPLVEPGLVEIAGILIRSAVTGEVLWKANATTGFESLNVRGSAARLPHERLARILSYGNDPQIYLPTLRGEQFAGPLKLEVWLKARVGSSSLVSIIEELVATNANAQITLDETGSRPPIAAEGPVLSVYALGATGFAEDQALHVAYEAGRWVHLLVPLEQRLGSDRLRIDPLAGQGLVDIAGVVLRSAVTGQALWKATDGRLDALEVRGSAVRLPHDRVARLFSYGDDPQVFLPEIHGVDVSEPLKLELWLFAQTGPGPLESILTNLVTTNADLLRKLDANRLELDNARAAVTRNAKDFAQCAADLDQEKRASAELNEELMQHRWELQETRTRLQSLQKERMLQESALITVQERLTAEQRSVDQLERELQILRRELAATAYELSEVTVELAELKRVVLADRPEGEEQPEETVLEKVLAPWKTLFGNSARAAPPKSHIEVKSPVPSFWIEHPTGPTVEGETIAVSGWALSSTGRAVDGIRVRTSGQIFVGQHAFERKDVAAAHPENPQAALSGFIVHLNLPTGAHIITLERLFDGGWETFAALRHEVRSATGEAENT